ncbi:hypothetical protein Gotri_014126, partial [Gossypium trilobum]|nr:hypothetical protein [Gossypium trilobum]
MWCVWLDELVIGGRRGVLAGWSHKKVTSFQTRTLPYFEDLSMIYGKDRVTGKNAQTPVDIIENLEGEENDNGGTENIENGI